MRNSISFNFNSNAFPKRQFVNLKIIWYISSSIDNLSHVKKYTVNQEERNPLHFFYFGRLLQMQMTLLWVLGLATFSLIFNSTQKPKDTFLKLYRDGIYTSFKARYLAEVVLWVNRVLFLAVFRFQRSGFKSRLRQVFSLLFLILLHFFISSFFYLFFFF